MKERPPGPLHLSFLIWLLLALLGLYLLQTFVFNWRLATISIVVPLAILVWGSVMLVISALQHVVLPMVKGIGCPRCSESTLERLGVQSFGHRYFRCTACGHWFKRATFGSWEEVKDPAELAQFDRAGRAESFEIEPWSEDDVALGAKSIDRLVKSQRQRK
jgi:hypothetical protein